MPSKAFSKFIILQRIVFVVQFIVPKDPPVSQLSNSVEWNSICMLHCYLLATIFVWMMHQYSLWMQKTDFPEHIQSCEYLFIFLLEEFLHLTRHCFANGERCCASGPCNVLCYLFALM